MSATPVTSATGGSASSQADSLDGRAWTPRPFVSFMIKVLLLVVPLVVGIVAVKVAMELVTRPHGWLLFWTWMIGLVAVSFVSSIGTQRLLRRFAPLAMLFKMSLVFPDEAPSRFKAAMRSGSTRSLARGAEGAGGQQAAAEELLALIARLSRHDRLTRGHVERVRAYSVMLGEQIGLSKGDLEKLNWAALIHDIGKLHVPEPLLNKTGRPTAEEWTVLRTHPGAGRQHVEPLRGWLGDWVDATTQHHERFDGQGYPRGLAGKDISLAGRIVSIADAYDVMTAARSYKKPLPAAQARAELTRNSGTQFDPHLVRNFLEISLGRLRRAIGPVGWLAHLPDLIRTPLTAVASSTTGIVAAGAIGVATVAGAAAPIEVPPPRHQSAPRVEEISNASSSTTIVRSAAAGQPNLSTVNTTVNARPAIDGPVDLIGDTATTTTTAPTTTTTTTTMPLGAGGTLPTVPVVVLTPPTTLAPTTTVKAPPSSTLPSPTTTMAPATTVTTAPQTTAPPTTAPPTTTSTTTTAPSGLTVAVDDLASGKDDKSISVPVLQNDQFGGSSADLTTLTVMSGPTHGSATISGTNIVYRSNHNFRGIDSFVYSICSLAGSCDQATVVMAIDH